MAFFRLRVDISVSRRTNFDEKRKIFGVAETTEFHWASKGRPHFIKVQ